jgi:hypothetical protein
LPYTPNTTRTRTHAPTPTPRNSASAPAPTSARVTRSSIQARISESEARIFQASSAFVSACQDATLALYALTAKLREIEKAQTPPKAKKRPQPASKTKPQPESRVRVKSKK